MCCMLNNSNVKYEWFIHNCGKSGLSFSLVLLKQKKEKKSVLKEGGMVERQTAKAAADQK